MGWETRRSGGLYYTRSHRRNGRVEREYIGTGVIGQLAAEQDARRRAERRQRAEAIEARKRQLKEVEAKVEAFCGLCDLITLANLLTEGIHYDRQNGTWRTWRKSRKGGTL